MIGGEARRVCVELLATLEVALFILGGAILAF